MSGKPQVLLYSKDMPLTEAVFKAAGMDFRNFVVTPTLIRIRLFKD